MGRIDKELAEREQRKQERREAEERRILREKIYKSDSGEAQAGALSDSKERNDGMLTFYQNQGHSKRLIK